MSLGTPERAWRNWVRAVSICSCDCDAGRWAEAAAGSNVSRAWAAAAGDGRPAAAAAEADAAEGPADTGEAPRAGLVRRGAELSIGVIDILLSLRPAIGLALLGDRIRGPRILGRGRIRRARILGSGRVPRFRTGRDRIEGIERGRQLREARVRIARRRVQGIRL